MSHRRWQIPPEWTLRGRDGAERAFSSGFREGGRAARGATTLAKRRSDLALTPTGRDYTIRFGEEIDVMSPACRFCSGGATDTMSTYPSCSYCAPSAVDRGRRRDVALSVAQP